MSAGALEALSDRWQSPEARTGAPASSRDRDPAWALVPLVTRR